MSSLKTLLTLFVVSATATPAAASNDLLREFASCAGRYGAQLDHAWLMNDPDFGTTATRRRVFAELVDALLPGARDDGLPTHQPLAWRVDARMAHAQLLQVATFGTNPSAREPARQLASDYIRACDQLLLSG